MRTPLAIVAASTLALAACGSDGDATDRLPDADTLVEEAAELGVSPLALALDQTASADAFRMEMAMGMSMDVGVGETIDFAADPDNPLMTAEQDADGEQHMVMDMASLMDAMGAGALLGDDLGMEMWLDGTTMYADYGSLGSMMALAGVEIPEGIFTVDLAELADVAGASLGGADIASTITGQAMPDPVEMATVLREVLADAEGDGSTYSGTIGFLDYSRAMGQDPAALTGGLDDLGGMVDADTLTSIFDELTVDVEVTIANGAADIIRYDIDMTPMFAAMSEAFGDGGGADSMFGDATMTMEMVMDYEIDATIDVEVPDGAFPDATDDLLELMTTGGPFG